MFSNFIAWAAGLQHCSVLEKIALGPSLSQTRNPRSTICNSTLWFSLHHCCVWSLVLYCRSIVTCIVLLKQGCIVLYGKKLMLSAPPHCFSKQMIICWLEWLPPATSCNQTPKMIRGGETNTNTNKNTNANTSPQTNIDTNHYWLIETSYSFSSLQSLRKNFTWPRLCWPSDPQSEGFNVILASRHLVVH